MIEQDFDTLIVHYLALGADATAFDACDPDRSGRPRLVVSASSKDDMGKTGAVIRVRESRGG